MTPVTPDTVALLNQQFSAAKPSKILEYLVKTYDRRLITSSTFALESQVLTHLLIQIIPNPRIFFLDTGRMFQETFDAMTETRKRFGIPFEYVFPDRVSVEKMVREKGPNLFLDSVANRQRCCQVRKIDSLGPILETCDVWVSGLRREQSDDRQDLEIFEFDSKNKIIKCYPLANWSTEEIWTYVRGHQLPYNKLHDRGFPSIGCAPCTRAVQPGEGPRSGRWWWESQTEKECGIHWRDGRLIRVKK